FAVVKASAAVAEAWRTMMGDQTGRYWPEVHYMRGPDAKIKPDRTTSPDCHSSRLIGSCLETRRIYGMELMSESPAWRAVGLRKESSNKALALLRGRPSMMANGELRPFAADHLLLKKKSLASQEENEWPTEGQTNPFTEPERTRIVSVHQKSQ